MAAVAAERSSLGRIRIGLIGCGRMGRVHLDAATAVTELDIAAICDPALALRSAAILPSPLLEFDELLALPEIDALLIAAPTPLHQTLVSHGLKHGKHVLCEKPLTLDPAADLYLAEMAAGNGLILQVGFWRRFAEPYLRMREIVKTGRIGTPAAVRAAQWDAKPPPPEFCDRRVSGGIEIDCGVHEFDLARWLIGTEVEAVTACSAAPTAEMAAVGDVDTLHGLARLTEGRVMTIDLTRRAGYRDSVRTEIVGTQGSIVADFTLGGSVNVQWEDRCEVIALASSNIIADAVQAQLHSFAEAVRNGSPDPNAAGGLDSRSALLAATELHRSRRLVAWCAVPS